MDMNLGKLQEMVRDREGWRAAFHGDSLEKTLMLGGIRGRKEEKGTTEDEMPGWHH